MSEFTAPMHNYVFTIAGLGWLSKDLDSVVLWNTRKIGLKLVSNICCNFSLGSRFSKSLLIGQFTNDSNRGLCVLNVPRTY